MIPTPPDEPADKADKKKKKKKDKVRSAWISFVGRILAQIIGAAASVIFGLLILQKYQSGREPKAAAASAASPTPAAVRTRRSPDETALAVLPLANFSGDPKQEYFADGLTEMLTANLAQLENVRVISRTSSMAYKGQHRPMTEIARELNVDLLVEGSVVREGERVRVTAQLIDGATDEHLWARSFDRTARDVLGLQDDIARAIAAAIGSARPAKQAVVDPAVYDLYLRGRFAWNTRTPVGFQEAEQFFKQAIEKDPNFALAYAGLADVYQLAGQTTDAAGATEQARGAARRALELDERVAEAHTSLAGLLHRTDANIKAAEREFRRAIDLNPNYATAHQWFAILLAEEARDGEAMTHAQRAIALDPLAAPMYQTLALVHYYGRRFDETIATAQRALQSAPQLPVARDLMARANAAKGVPSSAAALAPAAGTAGVPRTMALARWRAAAGNRDGAFAALADLVARSPAAMQPLKHEPLFDPLRSDPRFGELVQRAAARLESKS